MRDSNLTDESHKGQHLDIMVAVDWAHPPGSLEFERDFKFAMEQAIERIKNGAGSSFTVINPKS